MDAWLEPLDVDTAHDDEEEWTSLIATHSTGSNASIRVHRHSLNGTARLSMTDASGVTASAWSDFVCSARLRAPGQHHVAVVVDAGPRMVTWVVDGHLCDGGPMHDPAHNGTSAGWVLFTTLLGDVGGSASSPPVLGVSASVVEGRLYNSALLTTQCIGNWRAGYHAHRGVFEAQHK